MDRGGGGRNPNSGFPLGQKNRRRSPARTQSVHADATTASNEPDTISWGFNSYLRTDERQPLQNSVHRQRSQSRHVVDERNRQNNNQKQTNWTGPSERCEFTLNTSIGKTIRSDDSKRLNGHDRGGAGDYAWGDCDPENDPPRIVSDRRRGSSFLLNNRQFADRPRRGHGLGRGYSHSDSRNIRERGSDSDSRRTGTGFYAQERNQYAFPAPNTVINNERRVSPQPALRDRHHRVNDPRRAEGNIWEASTNENSHSLIDERYDQNGRDRNEGQSRGDSTTHHRYRDNVGQGRERVHGHRSDRGENRHFRQLDEPRHPHTHSSQTRPPQTTRGGYAFENEASGTYSSSESRQNDSFTSTSASASSRNEWEDGLKPARPSSSGNVPDRRRANNLIGHRPPPQVHRDRGDLVFYRSDASRAGSNDGSAFSGEPSRERVRENREEQQPRQSTPNSIHETSNEMPEPEPLPRSLSEDEDNESSEAEKLSQENENAWIDDPFYNFHLIPGCPLAGYQYRRERDERYNRHRQMPSGAQRVQPRPQRRDQRHDETEPFKLDPYNYDRYGYVRRNVIGELDAPRIVPEVQEVRPEVRRDTREAEAARPRGPDSLEGLPDRFAAMSIPSAPSASPQSSVHGSERGYHQQAPPQQAPSASKAETTQMIKEVTQFAPKLAPADRTGMEKVRLQTNQFLMEMNSSQDVYRYDIDASMLVMADDGRMKAISLLEGDKDDASVQRRHELVREALRIGLEQYRLLTEQGAVVYDEASMLFANENLAVALKPHNGSVTISVSQLPPRALALLQNPKAAKIAFQLRPYRNGNNHFTLGQLQEEARSNGGATDGSDRPLRQFLELLTDQNTRNRRQFVVFGAGKGFKQDSNEYRAETIGKGLERRDGFQKGIRFIEGTPEMREAGNGLVAALCLESRSGTFYKSQPLLDAIKEALGRPPHYNLTSNDLKNKLYNNKVDSMALKFIKNLRIEYINGESASFKPSGFSQTSLRQCKEQLNGSQQLRPTMDKFRDYNLRYADLPAVMQKEKDGSKFYHPIELLKVAEHQRVPLHKQTVDPKRAVPPQQKWNQIRGLLAELNLETPGGTSAPLMERFGVRLAARPIEVEGFRRPAPKLSYARNITVVVDHEKASWRSGNAQFKYGGRVGRLLVTYENQANQASQGRNNNYRGNFRDNGRGGGGGGVPPSEMARQFLDSLVSVCRQKGIEIGEVLPPREINLEREFNKPGGNNADNDRVFEMFAKETRNDDRVPILLYLDSFNNKKSHGLLKVLEAKYQLRTQHVTTEALARARGSNSTTMENIVLKFNMKIGGLNYEVIPEQFASMEKWLTEETMIIGYDVAHPTGLISAATALASAGGFRGDNPSVVGFSANCAANPGMFIGDYHYQTALKEQVSREVLICRMKWMLGLYMKNRGKLPENVFVLRDGVSEGFYERVVKEELFDLRTACDEFKNGYDPKFVVVVATKRHNKRFFEGTEERVRNPLPMTVVDTTVVSSEITEMFIQSHRPLQGTAKPTAYQLLHTDVETITSDLIQAFVLGLCFQHQICSSPISIPEPIYQADEWAKRGANVFATYREYKGLPRFDVQPSGAPVGGRRPNRESGPVDWEKMTQMLSYMGKRLEGIRINA